MFRIIANITEGSSVVLIHLLFRSYVQVQPLPGVWPSALDRILARPYA